MKYGFVIPVYNHGEPAYSETEKLLGYGIPIILVDDGSDDLTKSWLKKAASLSPLVTVISNECNLGKGGAVIKGIRKGKAMGLTHVLQLDADGQHDIGRVEHFIELSSSNPDAAIIGYPEYDDTVPASRQKGRNVANFFCHIATLDKIAIRDSMCGFRVYPVDECCWIADRCKLDPRMGFDIELVVRLIWARVPIINESVKVTYPEDGASHFHMIRDNARISWVFTKLIASMIFHLPSILYMRKKHKHENMAAGK